MEGRGFVGKEEVLGYRQGVKREEWVGSFQSESI